MMDLKVWLSPINDQIFVGRIGKRGDTLEKHDVTEDAINAVVRLIEKSGPVNLRLEGKLVKRLYLKGARERKGAEL